MGGTFTVLCQDSVRFNTNQTYRLSVTVNGSALTVSIDGVTFYSGTDSSHASGTVGFYTWRNSGATFDNVIVRGIVPTASNWEPNHALHEPTHLLAETGSSGLASMRARSTLLFPPLRSGEEALRKPPGEVGGPGWGRLSDQEQEPDIPGGAPLVPLRETPLIAFLDDMTTTRSLQ